MYLVQRTAYYSIRRCSLAVSWRFFRL